MSSSDEPNDQTQDTRGSKESPIQQFALDTTPTATPVGDAPGVTWLGLSPSARWLFHFQSIMSWAFFEVPLFLFAAFIASLYLGFQQTLILWIAVNFLSLMYNIWWPSLRFDRWKWVIRDQDVLLSRGVLLRRVTAIPLARIQHVDVHQGPIESWFGLARVRIHTASGLGADGGIPGLDKAQAEALRDRLVQLGGDDGV